ncbi:MAG: HAD family phosphatase [Bacteroidota bacterium]
MTNLANKYKNIIFDLGGVLLNIDYSSATRAFSLLGIDNFDKLFSQAQQSHLFDLYEKGQVSSEVFRNHIKSCFSKPIDDSTIDKAWNTMLLDFPPKRLRLLEQVKKTNRTFLLSNTNDIHMQHINAYLQKDFGIADLSAHFEKVYLSYQVGMRKPDAEIFELVLSENKLDPNETLFIDDSIQHIEGAKKLGIHTYWLDVKKESVLDVFNLEEE